MRWVALRVRAATGAAEAASAALLAAGSRGVSHTTPAGRRDPPAVLGYAPNDAELPALLDDLRGRLAILRKYELDVDAEPAVEELDEEDWATAWKRFYHPFRVGRGFVIRPSWEAYAPLQGERVIELDPGMAFGTGLHPSTQLSLAALEESVRAGDAWLDWGTGSGILAIAAAQLGAGAVDAVDNDPVAVEAAVENVRRNDVAGRVHCSTGVLPSAGLYGGIVANILADPITAAAPRLRELLAPNGQLIVSGFTHERAGEVERALHAASLRVTGRREQEGWACLTASASAARPASRDAPLLR